MPTLYMPLGLPTALIELTPFCSFPQVPQLRYLWHISTCSELRIDSGPCGTLAVAMVEVSPFTLLTPLVADVLKPCCLFSLLMDLL